MKLFNYTHWDKPQHRLIIISLLLPFEMYANKFDWITVKCDVFYFATDSSVRVKSEVIIWYNDYDMTETPTYDAVSGLCMYAQLFSASKYVVLRVGKQTIAVLLSMYRWSLKFRTIT